MIFNFSFNLKVKHQNNRGEKQLLMISKPYFKLKK